MAALLVAVGCRDAVQPSAILLRPLNLRSDTLVTGTPGLPQVVEMQATDLAGAPLAGAHVTWSAIGTGAAVQDGASVTDADGDLDAIWVMGTNASEVQHLQVQVSRGTATGEIELRASLVASQVATLSASPDSVAVRLGTSAPLQVAAVDPFGNVVPQPAVAFSSLDTGIATVSAAGVVYGLAVGSARVVATSQAAVDTVTVHVIQVPAVIAVSADTVRFTALGQQRRLAAYLVDDQGYPVAGTAPAAVVADSTVALVSVVAGSLSVQSRAGGGTTLNLTAGTLHRALPIVVNQVPASISITLGSTEPIMLLPIGAPVPATCQVLDSNGVAIPISPLVSTSSTGAVSGATCAALRVVRSGVDTLRVAAGQVEATVPIAVAAPPIVSPTLAESLQVDSIPSDVANGQFLPASVMNQGVVSMRRNSRGQLEIYISLMYPIHAFEDLFRYVSDDAVHFRYDGLVFRHDSTSGGCNPLGYGMENVAVVPRADGAGWRMFFAGGSFQCYGWQVFSAVSSDEKNWTIESGVRASNGGTLPPAPPPAGVSWPVGEGIVVDRLASGAWRMLVGGYDHGTSEDKFQIVEWVSQDQINWTYVGPVLRTEAMPPQGQASIYSPSIRQFAPGLWRMVFTGDNRNQPGGRFTLWSAVSTDQQHWQVEGQVMGQATGNFYYVAVVDSTLVTMRDVSDGVPTGAGFGRYMARATIQMP